MTILKASWGSTHLHERQVFAEPTMQYIVGRNLNSNQQLQISGCQRLIDSFSAQSQVHHQQERTLVPRRDSQRIVRIAKGKRSKYSFRTERKTVTRYQSVHFCISEVLTRVKYRNRRREEGVTLPYTPINLSLDDD